MELPFNPIKANTHQNGPYSLTQLSCSHKLEYSCNALTSYFPSVHEGMLHCLFLIMCTSLVKVTSSLSLHISFPRPSSGFYNTTTFSFFFFHLTYNLSLIALIFVTLSIVYPVTPSYVHPKLFVFLHGFS